ncbi:hypothetical protein MHZ92_13820 [Sporosarcina sp. ACRSL]|uniref:hypothetical protein n=1 Tax=Sporosarcina sp. ACRSL TaxID=2918215 RepID=UPI001EF59BA3|nr:hypothetical protein [Sporosarcina sp. ACRSL]MCG7345217.1 hypothetical protein [Sporosarcina sp. ACRSL]
MEPNKPNGEKAKVSLKDVVKQQLEAKKNKTHATKVKGNPIQQTPKMKSQQSKKVTQSSRKMGI